MKDDNQLFNKSMEYETVELDDEDGSIIIIDQTLLPGKMELIRLRTAQEIWDAIYLLRVRGAPAIGVTAAFGIYLLVKGTDVDHYESFYREFVKQKDYLNSARPTAVNLSWALERMEKVCRENKDCGIDEIKRALKQEALAIKEEDIWVCKTIGEYGLSLVKPGDGILTHCNAGQLATSKYGTATAPIYLGQERGYHFRVFADETRPLLQGARLTAYELQAAGMDVTLICDNMSAMVMKNGWINAVFVGCDRVALNGDTANKIGTSLVAIAAKRHNIPFYVCAPTSTIDRNTKTGGIRVISDAANAYPACCQDISGRYSDKGHSSLLSKKARGCSIKFQYSRNPSVIAERIPPLPRGSPILKKTQTSPAPSILADSSMAAGICLKPP